MDRDKFILMDPQQYDSTKKRCWHSRSVVTTLGSLEEMQHLSEKLQNLQASYFQLFVKGFRVWVDLPRSELGSARNQLWTELGLTSRRQNKT